MKRIKDYPMCDTNPWAPDRLIERLKFEEGGEKIMRDENDDVFVLKPAIKFKGKFVKDYKAYRKVFVDGLDRVKKLTNPGLRIFCYMLFHLDKDTDEIRLEIEKVLDYCDYKSTTQYYIGVMDLLDNDFIARKSDEKSSFFINVNIFFNGDRARMMKNKETKDAE